MRTWTTAAAAWLASMPSAGTTAPSPPADFVPTAYEIDGSYEPRTKVFQATAHVRLQPRSNRAREIRFVLHGELRATSVRSDSAELSCDQRRIFYAPEYSLVANEVSCRLPASGIEALTIAYEGRFSASAARWTSDYFRADADGLYLRGGGNSYWFPFFLREEDWRSPLPPVRVTLSAPAEFVSVMVGRRLGRRQERGRSIDEWYAQGLTYADLHYSARPFVGVEAPGLIAYSLRDSASTESGQRIAAFAAELVQRYRQAYRAAPAGGETTYVLQLPEFGDIASGNVVGLTDPEWAAFSLGSPSAMTLAHELVHAYAMLSVPAADPLFAFGTEGAASYFHIPVLAEMRGGRAYDEWMDRVQNRYLERLQPGHRDWLGPLPPLKPLLEIRADEVARYKDRFLLADRALLFWDFMRRSMGRGAFDEWVREITNVPAMDLQRFLASIRRRAPALEADAREWLEGTDYPERFRRG